MSTLSRLKVSLTKHGAHKVAELLDSTAPDEVIAQAWDMINGIKIDAAQARKVLSAGPLDTLPGVWHAAKSLGRQSINSITLLAILFSHHQIIEALKQRTLRPGEGTIHRNDLDNPKAYSNLKNDFLELGFSTGGTANNFDFDITTIINSGQLGNLALSLFRLKLVDAGWDQQNDPIDECILLGFHQALGMSEPDFRRWVSVGRNNIDELAETPDPDKMETKPFAFTAGHRFRRVGSVVNRGHGDTAEARLIHNELQNKLFDHLVSKHGRSNVGTEQSSGFPKTSIDLVLKTGNAFKFYEIKTSRSLRKTIREALPQLLEYAYWPNNVRASELIIVSTNKPTADAKHYLNLLRTKFGLLIYHETIDAMTGGLSDRI